MRAALIFAWLIFTSIACWYMLGQNKSIVSPIISSSESKTEIQVIDEASGSSYTDTEDQINVNSSENNIDSTTANLQNSEDQDPEIEVTNNKTNESNENSSNSIVVKAEQKETFDFLERTYIQFNQNSSTLPNMPDFELYLDSVANVVIAKNLKILLVGHSDSAKGQKYDHNVMGMKRANYIKMALLKRNVKTKNIEVESKGDSDPRIQGNTPEAKTKNRRVELFLKQNK